MFMKVFFFNVTQHHTFFISHAYLHESFWRDCDHEHFLLPKAATATVNAGQTPQASQDVLKMFFSL